MDSYLPGMKYGKIVTAAALAVLAGWVAAPAGTLLTAQQDQGVVGAGLHMRQLDGVKRVLMIAAHPDDEDTSLLAALARGMGAETAYLSLTRGEGGQNLIGPRLHEGLGVIRTGELLAARAL
ncbi:MAG: PIG-L family deacetylase, partial [Gemmatimonadota bacterium]|nr:PIG-L family deacetylase [Gemmatimonadota bacterium]